MRNESISREGLNTLKFYNNIFIFLILGLIFFWLTLFCLELPTLTQIIQLTLDTAHASYLPPQIVFAFSFSFLLLLKIAEIYPNILRNSYNSALRNQVRTSRVSAMWISIWSTLLDAGIAFTSAKAYMPKESWAYISFRGLVSFVLIPYMIMLGITFFGERISSFSSLIDTFKKECTSVVIRASELGYPYLPKNERASLGRFVALEIQPDFKKWRGTYRINYYIVTQEIDNRIHNYFKRKKD
jgi:hypothetical protein